MEKSAIKKKGKSPYLKRRRLEDIILAVQAMGVHPRADRKEWGDKLGKPLSAGKWPEVFSQHPEFFRARGGRTTLQLRHTYDKTYYADEHRFATSEELNQWTEKQKVSRLTPRPLNTDQIELLMRTAIQLHSRAIAQQEEGRWWKVRLLDFLFVTIGALITLVAQIASECLK